MVASNPSSYEECRRQRVEENKKRMEALNFPILFQKLRNNSSPKPSPMKKPKLVAVGEVRRSGRIANNPTPVYKEIVVFDRIMPRRPSSGRKNLLNRVYASDEARQDAIERAEELKAGLSSDFPSMVKPMLQSHVSGGFWLGLPVDFCRRSLPRQDGQMILIDEKGDEYPTVHLARKNGLSGGWKGFAVAHDLADGDAVVFQLIKRTTLKVEHLSAGMI
ncbi:hypothetical protein ACFE04_004835 [Oxalis oulophora]